MAAASALGFCGNELSFALAGLARHWPCGGVWRHRPGPAPGAGQHRPRAAACGSLTPGLALAKGSPMGRCRVFSAGSHRRLQPLGVGSEPGESPPPAAGDQHGRPAAWAPASTGKAAQPGESPGPRAQLCGECLCAPFTGPGDRIPAQPRRPISFRQPFGPGGKHWR